MMDPDAAEAQGRHYIIPAPEKRVSVDLEDVMKKFAWLLLFGGIVGLSLSLQAQQTPADIILTNGKIITVNDSFQIAQAVFGVGDGRERFVALAYRGVQLASRGLCLGLQAGERCGSLGVLLLQGGKVLCRRAGLFLQTGEALGGGGGLLFQIA